MSEKSKHFDDWAPRYDRQAAKEGFPLLGYEETLSTILRLADVGPGQRILDVGTGTGNLLERVRARGCEFWGIDFSPKMLETAQEKLPSAHFVCADLTTGIPQEVAGPFDVILSAYTFHEFDTPTKLRLVARLVDRLREGGRLLIGDVAFETADALSNAREEYAEWWEEEDYWIAARDLPKLIDRGYEASFHRVSFCGGIFRIERASSGIAA